MATYTENYDFTLPEEADAFDVADYNGNFETLDNLMAESETAMNEVNEKIGTPENGETVFSLLKSGGSIIKSIQRVTFSTTAGKTSGNVSINAVDPTKCIVIMERLKTNETYIVLVDYTLNASSIDIVHDKTDYDDRVRVAFWIIEFN